MKESPCGHARLQNTVIIQTDAALCDAIYPHSILPRGGRWSVDAQSGRGVEGGNMVTILYKSL